MSEAPHPPPFCSVIVPTFQRPEQLARCVAGLRALDHPADRFEIVVVDDGGREPVSATAYESPTGAAVRVVRRRQGGPAAARNTGAEEAAGELLAFIDDDCVPRPDWLRRLVSRWQAGPEEGVGGRTVNGLRDNLCSVAAQMIIDVGYRHTNPDPHRRWFTTNNLLVSADGFRAVGGFDESYRTSEDREFCARWAERGFRLAFEPEAVAEHFHALTVAGFARLHYAYGKGAFRFRRDRRRSGSPVPLELPFYVRMLREPFALESPLRALGLEALIGLWHASNLAGYVVEWMRERRNPA